MGLGAVAFAPLPSDAGDPEDNPAKPLFFEQASHFLLISLGPTWSHLDLLEFIDSQVDSLGFTRVSRGLT